MKKRFRIAAFAGFWAIAILAIIGANRERLHLSQAAQPVDRPLPACMSPLVQVRGKTFHVDPLKGRDNGDGSAQRPWRSLQKTVDDALIGDHLRKVSWTDKVFARLSRSPVSPRLRNNPDAIVRGGDTILLHSGEYGNLAMGGLANQRLVTIAAAPNANVRFSHISIDGISGFHFRDIVVEAPGKAAATIFVNMRPAATALRSDNVIFSDLRIGGTNSISEASPKEWAANSSDGILLFGDCLALQDSKVHDVHIAISLYQVRNAIVEGNEVQDFSVDGIDFSGRNIHISRNTIHDHWPTGDDFHPDCMQGQSTPDMPTYGPVRIENNICLSDTLERRSQILQGINIFDGRWQDVTIRCNFVRPTIQHGISLYGVAQALIERNVVTGWPNANFPWIAAMPSKEGRHPTVNVIRQNIATGHINSIHGGPHMPAQMIEAMKVNPDDQGIRAVLAKPIGGVTLADNAWLPPGPDLSADRRFSRAGKAFSTTISVQQARTIMAGVPGCGP